ncbi:estrogen sulfotransferase-like [Octopus vulgaris]|uniref:Estrogen sulfotransferase-like n=1 Tax=Octopus vulgaris TaxID=6645 RepID=A0AA36AP46_OCTVU|nr:estrogen sulfotransferase-like [Octopus vulgaris]
MDKKAVGTVNDGLTKVYDRAGISYFVYKYRGHNMIPIPVVAENLGKLNSLTIRTDDVLICSYPGTGSHWLFEMTNMILKEKSERISTIKEDHMLEISRPEMLDAIDSPRLLHTHLPPDIIPEGLLKDHKILYLTRNPKAAFVSYFRHMAALDEYGYRGTLENYLEKLMNGEVIGGQFFEYTHEIWRLIKDNPNAIVITYEEMKKVPFEVVSRIAKLLGKSISNQLAENIIDMCSFEKMTSEKSTESSNFTKELFRDNGSFYHNGQIATWKKWLTVEQSERIDACIQSQLIDQGINLNF